MANMSYCRFQNTVTDLVDCFHAIEEMNNGEVADLKKQLFEAKAILFKMENNLDAGKGAYTKEELREEIADLGNAISDLDLSAEERYAKKRLIQICRDIIASVDGE